MSNRWIRRHKLRVPPSSWAERHAPLAQIIAGYSTVVAIVVAALGFWYTVIPLHQKAAVDEQLAKRETELRQVELRLAQAKREAYELLRAGVVERLALRASFDCGVGRFGQRDEETSGKRRAGLDLLSEPIESCLMNAIGSAPKVSELNPEDLRSLTDATRMVGQGLDRKRVDLIKQLDELLGKARVDPSLIAPYSPSVGRSMAEMERVMREASALLGVDIIAKNREARFLSDVERTKYRLASEFLGECAMQIQRGFRSTPWPIASPSVAQK